MRLNGLDSGSSLLRHIGLTPNTKTALPDEFRSLLQNRGSHGLGWCSVCLRPCLIPWPPQEIGDSKIATRNPSLVSAPNWRKIPGLRSPHASALCEAPEFRAGRQLSGWNLPPLLTRAFGARCHELTCRRGSVYLDAANATPCRTVEAQIN